MRGTIDLNRVSSFVRVVDAGSFTAAAKALGLPKSSVSRSVSKLEEELGVRLLQRTTRRLRLTDAGEAFYERARSALAGLDDATDAAVDMGKEPRGTVRLTAPVDLGTAVLAGAIARFLKKYPKIRVELSLTGRVVDLVKEGFDLAVRGGILEDSSLIARRVISADMGLHASVGYLKKRGKPKTLAELAEHDCVLFRATGLGATWHLSGPAGDESVAVNGPIVADDFVFVQQAIALGVGIGLLPMFLCRGAPTGPSALVRVLPEYAVRGGSIHVVSPSTRYEPARVALLREFIIEELEAAFGKDPHP